MGAGRGRMLARMCRQVHAARTEGSPRQDGDAHLGRTGVSQEAGTRPDGGAGGQNVVDQEDGAARHQPTGAAPQPERRPASRRAPGPGGRGSIAPQEGACGRQIEPPADAGGEELRGVEAPLSEPPPVRRNGGDDMNVPVDSDGAHRRGQEGGKRSGKPHAPALGSELVEQDQITRSVLVTQRCDQP